MIEIWIFLCLVILFLLALYVLYDIIFSVNEKYMGDEHTLPHGVAYEPYHGMIKKGVSDLLELPFEQVFLTSYDGLKLAGRYYHQTDHAPLVIFFHGYRCSALRDGNGMFSYARKIGYNVLLADQRAHGKSEGSTITFGVKGRFDCKSWAEYAVSRFGSEQKIYLSGLSMGGATVLMAADIGLPKQVVGIIADCPYSSPKAILCSVIKQLGFPVKLTYQMAKLSGKWIGKFDVEEASAIASIRNSKIPILIIHGDADDFVPCYMSMDCQAAGKENVSLKLIRGAAHGMSYCVNTPAYEDALHHFFEKTGGI